MLRRAILFAVLAALFAVPAGAGQVSPEHIYNPGQLPATDSTLRVAVGQAAPDFTLPALGGDRVTLSSYRGRKNVVLSFVPAAFTPVCSDQWPGYNFARELFEQRQAIILGVSTDNTPSQYAWVREMGGLWFPVLSDFWPHGAVSSAYGVLRSTGVSERAIIIVDTQGVIRFIDVHDINTRPDLGVIVKELDKLKK
ncbi:MAG: peroxiredoxin [Thermodesulfobacteriota bacterium]